MSTLRVEALEQPDGTAFIFNNKNLLINGGMNVWQRGTSATGISSTSTDGYVTADRWETYNNSLGTWTQSRSTDVPSEQGFGYSLKMDCTTADASPAAGDELVIIQKIEAQNLQHLLFGSSNPKSIVLSFWVKSNKTGTYIINLVRTDVSNRSISKSYTIDTASTWEKKTITFAGDETNAIANDNGRGIDLNFYLAAGSNYTSGTLATSWEALTNANRAVGQVNLADSTSNEWYLTGCQLEVGSTASGFEFEPFEATLRKCHRYCRQWDRRGPSVAEDYTRAVYVGGVGQLATSTLVILQLQGTNMRDAPDVGFSATNDFTFSSTSGSEVSSALAVYVDGVHGSIGGQDVTLSITVSTGTDETAGRFFINDSTNGYLVLDAEL
jgi:hypothetical protein